jgi:hypothetical protein
VELCLPTHAEGIIVEIRSTVGLLLSAGAAALAIAAAPSALAAQGEQACSDMGGSTQCQRASNVQIYTEPQRLPDTRTNTTYGPFVGYHNGRV